MKEIKELQQRVEELSKENQQLRQIVFDLLNYNNSAIKSIVKPLENFKEFNNHFFEMVSKAKVMKGENDDGEDSEEILCNSK